MTVDREGFMEVLGEIWSSWTTADTIQKAAKLVGVSENGLDVDWMNQEKMDKAEMLIVKENEPVTPSQKSLLNEIPETAAESGTPEGMRRNSNEYWKFKLQKSEERNQKLREKLNMESEIDLKAIPGLLDQKKIRPKKKESVKITQVRGSMSGCDILTKLEELEKKKEEKIKQRDAKAQSLVDLRKKFDLCKDICVCTENECPMKDYKQCPVCFAVQKSACSKKACRLEDGSRPQMIRVNLPSKSTKGMKRKRVVDYVDDLSEGDESSDSENDDMIDYWAKNLQISRAHSDDESSSESAEENEIDASEGSLEADKSEPEALIVLDSSMFVGTIVNVDFEGELFPRRILEFVGREMHVCRYPHQKNPLWRCY